MALSAKHIASREGEEALSKFDNLESACETRSTYESRRTRNTSVIFRVNRYTVRQSSRQQTKAPHVSGVSCAAAVGRSIMNRARSSLKAQAKEESEANMAIAKAENQERISGILIKGLAKELGDTKMLEGWSVLFDLLQVSGDPDGVQRGPRLNSRDKSIVFVSPEGKKFKSRESVAKHFGIERPSKKKQDEADDDKTEEGSSPAAASARVFEPRPVETEAGLAFEVDRVIDERYDSKGKREVLVRWVGYGADDDSWEPEKGFLDKEPIAVFEARRPSLVPRDDAVWHRRRPVGADHQVLELPKLTTGRARTAERSKAVDPIIELPQRTASRRSAAVHEGVGQTAAMLTASAFGPISPLCYVAPTDCDLGLIARCNIPKGTPICEYAGPVLPRTRQEQSGYNLGIPGGAGGVGSCDAPFFIDGDSSQAPFGDDGRSLGPYANHSSAAANAGYQWIVAKKHAPHALAGALWVTANEFIPAGSEIRTNYEAEGRAGQYWRALGITPLEGEWKSLRYPPLPPACLGLDDEPCADRAPEPLPWGDECGGDERLRTLVPLLAPECTTLAGHIRPEFFGVVATHIPGRSGLECYYRWCQLTRAEPGLQSELMPDLLPDAGACFCGTRRHLPSSGLDFNGTWVVCIGCGRKVHGDCAGLRDAREAEREAAAPTYRCPDCILAGNDGEYERLMALKRARERTVPVVLSSIGCKHGLKVGEKIQISYRGPIAGLVGEWFPGFVAAIHDDATLDVHYVDGDRDEYVPRDHIKVYVTADAAEKVAAKEAVREATAAERAARSSEKLAAKLAIRESAAAERAAVRAAVAAERNAIREAAKAVQREKAFRWMPLSKLVDRTVEAGERVQAKFQGAIGGVNWFDGEITEVRDDGTYDIHFDDGDDEEAVEVCFIKVYVSRAVEHEARLADEKERDEREAVAAVAAAKAAEAEQEALAAADAADAAKAAEAATARAAAFRFYDGSCGSFGCKKPNNHLGLCEVSVDGPRQRRGTLAAINTSRSDEDVMKPCAPSKPASGKKRSAADTGDADYAKPARAKK